MSELKMMEATTEDVVAYDSIVKPYAKILILFCLLFSYTSL